MMNTINPFAAQSFSSEPGEPRPVLVGPIANPPGVEQEQTKAETRDLSPLFEPIMASPAKSPDVLNGQLKPHSIQSLDDFKEAVRITATTGKALQLQGMSYPKITAALEAEGYRGDAFDYIKEKCPGEDLAAALCGADFYHANLNGLNLSSKIGLSENKNIRGVNFKYAQLAGAELSNLTFSTCSFDNAFLIGAGFTGSSFKYMDFLCTNSSVK